MEHTQFGRCRGRYVLVRAISCTFGGDWGEAGSAHLYGEGFKRVGSSRSWPNNINVVEVITSTRAQIVAYKRRFELLDVPWPRVGGVLGASGGTGGGQVDTPASRRWWRGPGKSRGAPREGKLTTGCRTPRSASVLAGTAMLQSLNEGFRTQYLLNKHSMFTQHSLFWSLSPFWFLPHRCNYFIE
jgi:hypothetical protein